MTGAIRKTLFINKEKRVNSEVFNETRLARGLSRFQLAIEINLSPQTIRRVLTSGCDPQPATVKKIGEYLGIPPHEWYVPREHMLPETGQENTPQAKAETMTYA